jgi:amino acid transporter
MGSGIAAQFGASRLLYSMGRSGSLPRFFGAVDERHHVPRNNVLLVGGAALAGAFLLTYEQGAELLNFGAFIAFIGVNAAALVHYRFRSKERVLLPALIPALGILICVFIWLHLNHGAQVLGAAWLAVGLVVAWLMRRSRRPGSVETGT